MTNTNAQSHNLEENKITYQIVARNLDVQKGVEKEAVEKQKLWIGKKNL